MVWANARSVKTNAVTVGSNQSLVGVNRGEVGIDQYLVRNARIAVDVTGKGIKDDTVCYNSIKMCRVYEGAS